MSQRRSNQPQHPTGLSALARQAGIVSAWNMAAPGCDAGGVLGLTPFNTPTKEVLGGKVGAVLNGSNQYWTGAEGPRFAFGTGDFLLMGTFRTTASSISMLVARSDGSGTAYYLSTDSTGKLRVDIASGGAILSTTAWNDGKVHAGIAVRRNGTIEFYCDGISDGSGTRSNDITGTGKVVLGRYGTASSFYLNGAMYMAAIGNKAPPPNVCRELSKNPWRIFSGVPEDFVGKASGGGVTVNLSGQSATASIGAASTSAGITLSPTGQSTTTSLGSITTSAGASLAAAGQSTTTSLGTVATSSGVTLTLVGQSVAAFLGAITVSSSASVLLAGQLITSTLGAVVAEVGGAVTVALSGMSATAYIGSVAVSAGVGLSLPGQLTTSAIGTLGVGAGVDISIGGQQVLAQLGALGISASSVLALSGLPASTAVGAVTISAATAASLQGMSFSSTIGALSIVLGGPGAPTPSLARLIAIPAQDRVIVIAFDDRTIEIV